jgi:hypothetical protein
MRSSVDYKHVCGCATNILAQLQIVQSPHGNTILCEYTYTKGSACPDCAPIETYQYRCTESKHKPNQLNVSSLCAFSIDYLRNKESWTQQKQTLLILMDNYPDFDFSSVIKGTDDIEIEKYYGG